MRDCGSRARTLRLAATPGAPAEPPVRPSTQGMLPFRGRRLAGAPRPAACWAARLGACAFFSPTAGCPATKGSMFPHWNAAGRSWVLTPAQSSAPSRSDHHRGMLALSALSASAFVLQRPFPPASVQHVAAAPSSLVMSHDARATDRRTALGLASAAAAAASAPLPPPPPLGRAAPGRT